MKLNEKEIKLFKLLSKSDIGKDLIEYCDRLITYTCDVRNMNEKDTKESIQKAADIIETHLINRIKKVSDLKEQNPTSFR